ncbi:MAG: sulfatase-like hydrolase/transferase [Verrucomicrobia bacterium]|nr:sulfatase-like hydrolase/transferase [Verrucomicrobiota bacterium]
MKRLLILLCALCLVAGESLASEKPNIIFILADDYGIPGVGCCGGVYKTPNLDSLAAGGIRFERCLSAPLCAPSRALCMFGRYAFRTGVLDNGCGAAAKPDKEVSIAKTLKQAGYATALAGKWSQLSYLETAEEGRAWGFDEFLRWDKSRGERYWKPALNKNGQVVPVTDESYAPDMFHDFVVDFIKRHRDEPFFVYYPTTLIHGPILATPDSKEGAKSKAEGKPKSKGERKGKGENPLYIDNIAYLDKLVGKLVAALDEMKLREKTLIVFTGDNGSVPVGTINGRAVDGHKSHVNEGGSRVPLIANWKGTTPAGRVLKDLVGFSDFYATFSELAGAKLPEGVTLDSRSFAPQLRGEKGTPREWTYVQLGAKWYARNDGWKLTEKGELFDMSDAPFAQKPVTVDAQTAEAKAAREQLQGVLDKLNPAGGVTKERKKGDGDKKQKKRKKNKKDAANT